ncbi:MAG TPA: divalent-cation tolerance protein CutA [Longimicrobiales bacterium]|nr:divalent-cation tolerance protein CutA [Longimicrobiales bacterium]
MNDIRVVLMTAPTAQAAGGIVDMLVGEHLIACGNITTSISSIYRWQGNIERADEVLVIMKTTAALLDALTKRIGELHPYEVPEVLALDVVGGNAAYSAWVRESVRS